LVVVLTVVEVISIELGDDVNPSVLPTDELEVEPAMLLVLELLVADVAPSDVTMEGVDEVPWPIVLVLAVVGLPVVELACEVKGSVLATDKVDVVVVSMLLVLVTIDDTPCDALTKVVDDVS